MLILDGKVVSQARRTVLTQDIDEYRKNFGRVPHLVVVLVGADVASQVYVRNKEKACQAVGIKSTKIVLPEVTPQDALERTIISLNENPEVDGILVQSPLPKGLSEVAILDLIDPLKDVDGFTFKNLGYLWGGQKRVAPCTPAGVISILDHYKIPIKGQKAVVVGRSNIVGKPMAHLLTERNATVTVCHSKTVDILSYTKSADLVVVAAGRKHLFSATDFKKGAVVVDVGIHGAGAGGSITGDVNPQGLEEVIAGFTPVPGGVGPMTITTLLENTLHLAKLRNSK
jgi:methylenetetrahydrofolate dehydrogenase (NADP+)/methenyltetrahydrofolate cyclohydrolase